MIDYKVNDVIDIEYFLEKYYKKDRYTGRGVEYATQLLNIYKKDMEVHGYVFISHHDSVTGEIVAYYK